MKNIFLFIFFVLPAMATAQFTKGDAFLGGTVSGSLGNNSSDNSMNTKSRDLRIAPIVGFLISDRFALGGKLEFGLSKNISETSSSQITSTNKNYGVGAMGKYFFPLSEKFMFALTGNIYYSRSHFENQSNGGVVNDIKGYTLGLTVNPTFLYFPSKRWGFEANIGSIGYTHYQDLSRNFSHDNFQATYGSISLGVAYYFRN